MDFDTEAEPFFNVNQNTTRGDQLEDWLHVLATENITNVNEIINLNSSRRKGKTSVPTNGSQFKQGVPVGLIIELCDELRQSSEVKYQAIELYDHFMVKHICELRRHVNQEGKSKNSSSADCTRDKTRKEYWETIVERIKKQALLRVLSCVQIAGKLHSPKNALPVTIIEKVLTNAGMTFSRKSILKSELRILSTVSFNPALPTPLVYLETLLEILGHNDTTINIKALYFISLKILDLVYLRRTEVYKNLFSRISQSHSATIRVSSPLRKRHRSSSQAHQSTRDKTNKLSWITFLPVIKDLMFLSTAVISCGAYHLDQVGYIRVTERLQSITQIPFDEIFDFTIVLVGLTTVINE